METSFVFLVLLILPGILSSQIPQLTASGSHYEVGLKIGLTFSKQVQGYFSGHPFLDSVYVPWSRTSAGQKVVGDYLEVANASFPQYVMEMQGMAQGAQVDFLRLLLMNLRSEISALLDTKEAEACSDIHINHPEHNSVGVCHNEDGDPAADQRSYILHLSINAHPALGTPAECFTVFSYPGELPGNAFGFNKAGLTISVNALYPKLVMLKRTPRSLLTRALLASGNLSDAVRIMKDASVGAAYGFCANIGVLGESPAVYSIEAAPSRESPQTILNIHQVFQASHDNFTGNYFHVNLYRQIHTDERPDNVESSQHRTARIKQLPLPKSFKDVLYILGDTADSEFPIFRQPRPTDNESTLATAAFDLLQGTLAVYKGNPKTALGPDHIFHITSSGQL